MKRCLTGSSELSLFCTEKPGPAVIPSIRVDWQSSPDAERLGPADVDM